MLRRNLLPGGERRGNTVLNGELLFDANHIDFVPSGISQPRPGRDEHRLVRAVLHARNVLRGGERLGNSVLSGELLFDASHIDFVPSGNSQPRAERNNRRLVLGVHRRNLLPGRKRRGDSVRIWRL